MPEITTRIENYYGQLSLIIENGKYFLYLPDYKDELDSKIEVSKEFGNAFIKECESNSELVYINKNPKN